MQRSLTRLVLPAFLFCSLMIVDDAFAARRRAASHYRGGTAHAARPVTGYGANLHRRFVLKQELKRAQNGLPVRNRGNILWYR